MTPLRGGDGGDDGGSSCQDHALWHVLAHTGMHRCEALSLRWRDVGLGGGTLSVRRSAAMVRVAGEGAGMVEVNTKSGKPRVIDLDPGTTGAAARLAQAARFAGAPARQGRSTRVRRHRGPAAQRRSLSRQFARDIERCRKDLGEDALPVIWLHDPRHSRATILLTAREPMHVVSQRLGHSSAVVTMTVYSHVLPGSQRETADLFAQLAREAIA